ncbi:hypothetical protein A2U01_0081117, partial [Trifolium medium]|nr:hypothetical protein [Trifolium medium]
HLSTACQEFQYLPPRRPSSYGWPPLLSWSLEAGFSVFRPPPPPPCPLFP